jgi:hypothetical protein
MSTTITASKANIQNATTTNLNVAKITGSVIATPKEIKDGIVTNKVVTPFSAKLALSLFTSLGNAGTNANFTTVTMADFAGNVIADSKTAIAGTASSKIITPLTLLSVLNNPGKIGLQTPNNAIFTNITADSIQGDVIASGSEISAGSVNNKTISPFEMYNSLQAPSVIGSSNPGAAKFTNVTATSLNLTTDILQVSEGGLGTNSFNRGDILVASDSTVISKLPSLDLFYINTELIALVSLVVAIGSITMILASKKMSEGKINIGMDLIYYLSLYMFIAPLWIGKAAWNAVFSIKTTWR